MTKKYALLRVGTVVRPELAMVVRVETAFGKTTVYVCKAR